jgi:hypothetical protein
LAGIGATKILAGLFLRFGRNWHHNCFGWIVFEIWGDWRPTKFPGNFWRKLMVGDEGLRHTVGGRWIIAHQNVAHIF